MPTGLTSDVLDPYSGRVPRNLNRFTWFANQLLWIIVDSVAEFDLGSTMGTASNHRARPVKEFASVVEEVRQLRNNTRKTNWVLSPEMIKRCRPLLSSEPLGLYFHSRFASVFHDEHVQIHGRVLEQFIDATRGSFRPPLDEQDRRKWLSECRRYQRAVSEPVELSELVDELQDWHDRASRLAKLLDCDAYRPKPRFRKFEPCLETVADELVERFAREKPKSGKFDRREAAIVLCYLDENDEHRLQPLKVVARELTRRAEEGRSLSPPPTGKLQNILKTVFLRGYGRNGKKQGHPDPDVLPLIQAD